MELSNGEGKKRKGHQNRQPKGLSSVLGKHVFSSHNTTSPSHCSALRAHVERDICSEMATVERIRDWKHSLSHDFPQVKKTNVGLGTQVSPAFSSPTRRKLAFMALLLDSL